MDNFEVLDGEAPPLFKNRQSLRASSFRLKRRNDNSLGQKRSPWFLYYAHPLRIR